MGTILTKDIRKTIRKRGPNKLYRVSDFAYLNNDALVTRVLSRLAKEKMLIRVSQGLYLYPLYTKYGPLRPSAEEIAYIIAKKDKARIIPHGLYALNRLGLSTQVMMNAVFLTDGAARVVFAGNRKITFIHSAPRNFAYKTDLFPLIAEAMKTLGKDKVTDEHITIIKETIELYREYNNGNIDKLKSDCLMAPRWIRQRLAL